MAESHAIIRTEKASRYLQQLCKHFAHKVPSEFDAAAGRVEFPPGLCHMAAEGDTLAIYCQSATMEGLVVMQGIVDNHMQRFAWREDIAIAWQTGLPEDLPAAIRNELVPDAQRHA